MAQPPNSDDGNPVERFKRFYASQPLWWRIWQRSWWCWEVGLYKLTGRKHPMERIMDQTRDEASRKPRDQQS